MHYTIYSVTSHDVGTASTPHDRCPGMPAVMMRAYTTYDNNITVLVLPRYYIDITRLSIRTPHRSIDNNLQLRRPTDRARFSKHSRAGDSERNFR